METLKVQRVVLNALNNGASPLDILRFQRVDRHRFVEKTIQLSRRLFRCFTIRQSEFVQRDLLIEIRHERALAVHPRDLHR